MLVALQFTLYIIKDDARANLTPKKRTLKNSEQVFLHSDTVDDEIICVSQQEKPKVIDPLDYEAVISELEDEFREDPLQDLLLFPDLDFTVSSLFSLSVCIFASVYRVCIYLWCPYSFTSH